MTANPATERGTSTENQHTITIRSQHLSSGQIVRARDPGKLNIPPNSPHSDHRHQRSMEDGIYNREHDTSPHCQTTRIDNTREFTVEDIAPVDQEAI